MKINLVPVAMALLVGACATQPAVERNYMSGEEIQALLAEPRNLKLKGPEHTGNLVLNPDGTAVGEATTTGGKTLDISGIWEIDGDQFCRVWEFNKPRRQCEDWERIEERVVSVYIDDRFIGTNSW